VYQDHQYTEQIQKQVAIEQSKFKMDITVSVATVATDAFKKKLNYNAEEIS
jgi:hypothetical protein